MPIPIAPKDECKSLDEAAVLAALDDPSSDNPIAQEVARLVEGYAANFADWCSGLGAFRQIFCASNRAGRLKLSPCA